MLDVSRVHENKDLVKVVPEGNYVLDVANGHLFYSGHVEFRSVKILLIICDLYH